MRALPARTPRGHLNLSFEPAGGALLLPPAPSSAWRRSTIIAAVPGSLAVTSGDPRDCW